MSLSQFAGLQLPVLVVPSRRPSQPWPWQPRRKVWAASEGMNQSFVRSLRRHVAFLAAMCLSRVGKMGKATAKIGKIALITGASTGIGKATAAALAQSGQYSTIFLAGHNESKTRTAVEDLKGVSSNKLEYLPLELASLDSVRQAAKSFQDMQLPLHSLICNAAVMALPERKVTQDGYEFQFEVNYLSHFLLVNLLLPQLAAAGTPEDPARIISVSSSAHFVRSPLAFGDTSGLNLEDSDGTYAYYPWTAYGQSKLAQVMFTYELARRLEREKLPVVANVVDPGVVDTELQRYLPTPVGVGGMEGLAKGEGPSQAKSFAAHHILPGFEVQSLNFSLLHPIFLGSSWQFIGPGCHASSFSYSGQAPAAVMKFAKSPRQGAETSVQLAKEDSTGGYWVDGKCLS